jgi:hypothetical protein
MSPVVVFMIIVVLVSVVLGVYFFDRRTGRDEPAKQSNEFAFPLIDELPIGEAKRQAIAILERFAERSTELMDHGWAVVLHKDTIRVLESFRRLAFDSLTCQLAFRAHSTYDRSEIAPGGYVRIGTWPAGEGVFARIDCADPQVYVEVGENQFEVLAPTIFHYIVKAKQESDWADELLDSHD